LLERLLQVGQRGVSVRKLGGDRAGELRITRFLRNTKVSAEAVFAHAAAETAARVAGYEVVVLQDTTSLRADGSGGSIQAHVGLAVEAETGACLGLAHGQVLTRAGGKAEQRRTLAFEAKESRRWLDGVEAAAELAQAGARAVTVVGDRESDIYPVFARRPGSVELVIRAAQDRALRDGGRLFATLAAAPLAGRFQLAIPAAPGRQARTAEVELRFRTAALTRPAGRPEGDSLPAEVPVTLVEAREVGAPAGVTPALWRLVTTHQVNDVAGARRVCQLYRQRWCIEELFRTVKTKGFDIERVEIAERPFEVLAAATLVAGASVLALVQDREGRGQRPLEDVFQADEQAALEAVSARLEGKTARQKNPHPKASLAFAAWVCARLGGWTGYYGKPGPVVMLRGLYEFRAMQQGWSLAQNVRIS
jgi:hypothetical protein